MDLERAIEVAMDEFHGQLVDVCLVAPDNLPTMTLFGYFEGWEHFDGSAGAVLHFVSAQGAPVGGVIVDHDEVSSQQGGRTRSMPGPASRSRVRISVSGARVERRTERSAVSPLAGIAASGQADFGAGIYRGREAPENAAYDLLNCLLDDEGQPFRRGGSAYLSTSASPATLLGLADVVVAAGQRTLMWTSAALQVLDGSSAPVTLPLATTGTGTAIPRSRSHAWWAGVRWRCSGSRRRPLRRSTCTRARGRPRA